VRRFLGTASSDNTTSATGSAWLRGTGTRQHVPGDRCFLYTLASDAAKNVCASSGGADLLAPGQRRKYLARARMHFEAALKADPKYAGAVNGKGKVPFYERKFDDAVRHHEQAIKRAGGSYPAAEHDLSLVRRLKSGAVLFPESNSGRRVQAVLSLVALATSAKRSLGWVRFHRPRLWRRCTGTRRTERST